MTQRRDTRKRAAPGDAGLTLIELIMAVLILSLATLAGMRAVDGARRAVAGEATRALALHVAQNRAARIRIEGAAGAGAMATEATMAGRVWRIETQPRNAPEGLVSYRLHVMAADGAGAVLDLLLPADLP